jgi:GNAT superfamily N-acetyltransferase
MILRHPNQSDWETFSVLACLENWRVPRTELQLLKGSWAHYVRVLDDDKFCGLVSAVVYEKSAWVGNLIVPHHLRGKGYGSHLFKFVLADLAEKGMTSIWLTASDQGRSIYEKEGFVEVDRIERWVLPPPGNATGSPLQGENSYEKLFYADRLAWSENRAPILSVLCNVGKVFTVEGASALLQTGPDVQIIGPWYAHDASLHAHQTLLKMMIAATDPNVPVVVDLFASSPLPAICDSSGFLFTGRTSLMAYGDIGSIDLKSMVSLASLGSVG